MNDRLEKLAKEAAEYAIEFATQDQELYIPTLMERFAELIVKECAEVCFIKAIEQAEYSNRPEVNTSFANGVKCLAYNIAGEEILQHFGVEE